MKHKKINILFVIHGLPVGGAEKMFVNLVNRMNKTHFNTLVALLNDHNPISSDITNARLFCIPRRWKYDLNPSKKLSEIINTYQIDMIVCFGMFEFFFIKLSLRKSSTAPLIFISIHSSEFVRRRHLRHFQNWLYARFLNGRERFFSVCNAQAFFWKKKYRIAHNTFTTIYNCVDVDHFNPRNAGIRGNHVRERYNIPEEAFVFIMVANLSPVKRHEDAISAFSILEKMDINRSCYLLLVGNGSQAREHVLKVKARQTGTNKIIFCGHQDNIKDFLQASNVFTLTSVGETFSVAALEAMAMGLPCVLTDICGAAELINEDYNGFLVPPKNPEKMAAAWAKTIHIYHRFNPKMIRNHIKSRFSITHYANRYHELLIQSYHPHSENQRRKVCAE